MNEFGKKGAGNPPRGDENPPREDVGREVVLPASGKGSIIATRELPKARRLLLHLLISKGKGGGHHDFVRHAELAHHRYRVYVSHKQEITAPLAKKAVTSCN